MMYDMKSTIEALFTSLHPYGTNKEMDRFVKKICKYWEDNKPFEYDVTIRTIFGGRIAHILVEPTSTLIENEDKDYCGFTHSKR